MARSNICGRWLAVFGLGGALVLSVRAATEDDPKVIQAAQQDLAAQTQPEVGLIFNALRDASDIQVIQGGAEVDFWVNSGLPLRLQAMWGDFSQDRYSKGSNDFERTALHLFLDEYRFGPAVWVSGRLSGEFFDTNEELFGGLLGVHYQQENRTIWSLDAASDSFWTIHDVRNPRQYPRVNNLNLIDLDSRLNRLSGSVDWVPAPEQQVRLQVGGTDFQQDDNEEIFAYAHYQVPILDSEVGRWTVLRPNIYYEHFNDSTPAYFSPDSFVALGLAGHTVREDAVNRLEFEINPVLLFEQGDVTAQNQNVEAGLHLVLDYTRKLGHNWEVGVGGFLYGETTDYWLWRTTAQCSYKF